MAPSRIRVACGFLIAPGIPALVLYLINLRLVPSPDAQFGAVIVGILAYTAALIVGLPAFLLLRRRQPTGILGHAVLGGMLGLIFYVLIVCVLLSGYQSPFAHAISLFRSYAMSAVFGAGYAAVAGALFWLIAIRT
jgi:hypothetical protein